MSSQAPELAEIIVGTLILAIGLAAISFASLRGPTRDRASVWFGIFAALYGIRLVSDSAPIQQAAPLPASFFHYADAFITYLILIPGGLFVESLMGPGWRGALRRTWQACAVAATAAIAFDVVRGEPEGAHRYYRTVVVIAGSIALAHLLSRWRRSRWPREAQIAAVGGILFLSAAFYETITGESPLGSTWDLEPFAMLIFIGTLAHFVARRAIASERRLAEVSRELELARTIQQSILPRDIPRVPGLGVAASCLPASDIAGDFYDFIVQDGQALGIIVADVSGHGIPAAIVASMVKIAFAAEAPSIDDPGKTLGRINRTLCGAFDRAYVTAFCGFIDPQLGIIRYASAGHPAPLMRRPEGDVQALDPGGLILAFDPSAQYATAEMAFDRGARLLIYTDGLSEAANRNDEPFGDRRMIELLSAHSPHGADRFTSQMIDDVRRWRGDQARMEDDITIVVVDRVSG